MIITIKKHKNISRYILHGLLIDGMQAKMIWIHPHGMGIRNFLALEVENLNHGVVKVFVVSVVNHVFYRTELMHLFNKKQSMF